MRKLPILLAAFVYGAFCQSFHFEPASPMWMPGEADSNSPAHWWKGLFYLYNSNGNPVRSVGENPTALRATRAVLFDEYTRQRRWIESTWVDDDGTIYAWYHYEPPNVCNDIWRSAPQIGALYSKDGAVFYDLGIVLDSAAGPECNGVNEFFAGGSGDFSVILDREREYFYFLYSQYGGDTWEQGIALARMPFADRAKPVGTVAKYFDGAWNEKGIGGHASPVLVAHGSWHGASTDAYWGPSLHWNTYLQKYVMLMNRACCGAGWRQDGVYITFNDDVANPRGWSAPVKVVDKGNWYPQVLGFGPGESDKLAGQRARFFVGAFSDKTIVFSR